MFPEKGGHGVFATVPIKKGTILVMFGGTVVTEEQMDSVPDDLKSLSIQVEEDLFLISTVIGPGDHFNHSCSPNAGMDGQIALIAMRDIVIAEEITFDYAMCDSAPYDEFDCMCDTPDCRLQVTGDDWQKSELWEKYDGYFSPYIQRKVDIMREKELANMKSHKV